MTSSLYQVALPRFPARPVFLLEDRAGGGTGVGWSGEFTERK